MTTVTEAAKRLIGGDDESALREGDLERICGDAATAQKLARRLVEAAREASPGRAWSIEDLRDVLDVAVTGPREDGVRVLEGRYFRKRLREQCALAERYRDPFACIVVRMPTEAQAGAHQTVLDAVSERLRRTDMVFVYKRRLAVVLPRMRRDSVGPLVDRIRDLLVASTNERAVEGIEVLCYPDPALADTQAVLDWAEDQLRDD